MRGPFIVLSPITKSHPFEERKAKVGPEDDPLKIGRSVARLKPTRDNAIFDCKVLSRNHAILWYKEGEYFLRDTKSSNGTFVNNDRLAVTGEESEARQISTGDIIQFGVEIVENTNKVTHGCIYAMVQLFDAEGQLMETANGTMNHSDSKSIGGNYSPSLVNNHQLFQLQQYISEAMYREEARQAKLESLERILETTEMASESAWKALVNEDRLLSRIETLEAQLATYTKNATADKLRDKMQILIEDKAKFEIITKEALRRAEEERAEAALRLADVDRSIMTTEEECNRLRSKIMVVEAQLNSTVQAADERQVRLEYLQRTLQDMEKTGSASEDRIQELQSALSRMGKEKDANENSIVWLVNRVMDRMLSDDGKEEISPEKQKTILTQLLSAFDIHRGFDEKEEQVPEPPSPAKNYEEQSESSVSSGLETMNKNSLEHEDRETAIREEMESYLKYNLQLQARIKELEGMIVSQPQQLDMEVAKSISAEPRVSSELLSIESKSDELKRQMVHTQPDPLTQLAYLLSLAPLLVFWLFLARPLHDRFFSQLKKAQ